MNFDTVCYRVNAGASQAYTWALPHDPSLVERRAVDFTEAAAGRTITGVEYGASGMTLVSVTPLGAQVYLVIAGGVDGTPATVQLAVTLSDGSQLALVVSQTVTAYLTPGETVTVPAPISATTTNATPTLLQIVPAAGPAGCSIVVQGTIIARNMVGTDTVTFALFAIVGGLGTAPVMEYQSAPPLGGSTAIQACAVAVQVAGGQIEIMGTGVAGLTLAWGGAPTWSVA